MDETTADLCRALMRGAELAMTEQNIDAAALSEMRFRDVAPPDAEFSDELIRAAAGFCRSCGSPAIGFRMVSQEGFTVKVLVVARTEAALDRFLDRAGAALVARSGRIELIGERNG